MGPDKILALAVTHSDVDGIAIVIHLLPAKGVLDRAVVDLIQIPLVEQRDRTAAGFTAPAWGLYLDRVFYEQMPNERMEG